MKIGKHNALLIRARQHWLATHRPEQGASLVEYALLVTLIAMVCLLAVMFFGDETSRSFSSTANSISVS